MLRVVVVTTRRHLGADRLDELERIFGPVDIDVVDSFRLDTLVSVVAGATAVVLDAVGPSTREKLLSVIPATPVLRPMRQEVKDRAGGLGARFTGSSRRTARFDALRIENWPRTRSEGIRAFIPAEPEGRPEGG